MTRFSPVEKFLLLGSILVVVAGLAVVGSRRFGLRSNPNAKLSLDVTTNPPNDSTPLEGTQWGFSWRAKAIDNPRAGLDVRYVENIVVSGHGHSQILYDNPLQSSRSPGNIISGASSHWANDTGQYVGGNYSGRYDGLPMWIEKMEWRGEFVATPQDSGMASGAVKPIQLDQLARQRGTTHVTKWLAIPLSARGINPIRKCGLEPVNAQNAARGIDTCIALTLRESKRKVFRQLTAFDGKTRRVLWSDGNAGRNPYWKSEQTSTSSGSPTTTTFLLFQLNRVPTSWGEITFSLDALYSTQMSAGTGVETCTAAAIEKLKSQGWLAFSRQLVVRDKTGIGQLPT